MKTRINLIALLVLLIIKTNIAFSQLYGTPQPTPPAGGTNSVVFDEATNSYIFYYNGQDGDLSYYYDLDNGGCLNGLTATVNNSYTFWPSYFGGITATINNIPYYPWSSNVWFDLLEIQFKNNVLSTRWAMNIMINNQIYLYLFKYEMHIEGRTLVLNVTKDSEQNENLASEFSLDRSYSDPNLFSNMNHYCIDVPYLRLFNILYTGSNSDDNNNVFTSFFFDWTNTNASEFVPMNYFISNNSRSYSQNAIYKEKTDQTRNSLNEIIYLTVSPELDDDFPNIPNPVSNHRNESINRIVFDCWQFDENIWNTLIPWELDELNANNISNCWMIVHRWQKNGYDCGNPTDIMPANQICGGHDALLNLRNKAVNELGYLFSLHEDYWFIQEGVPGYDPTKLSLPVANWYWCWGQRYVQHPIKPSRYIDYYSWMAPLIRDNYNTNSSYDDAFTNALPSFYVDLDAQEVGAGKFTFAHEKLRETGSYLQNIYNGPVSAEGGSHFLYVGYFDDFEAEIYTAKQNETGFKFGGYFRPLLVNFDLKKMREKTFVHGVGYYDRFFCNRNYLNDCWSSDILGMGHDSVLTYTATELAYAHGGFFSPKRTHEEFLYQANIQHDNVFPMQSLYADAGIVSILYNDNGNLLTASGFIKKYPDEFDCFGSDNCDNSNFMGQVRIEYEGNIIVYVNRHPWKNWIINDIPNEGWYNYHVAGIEPVVHIMGLPSYDLPPENGWVCYSPVVPMTNKPSIKKEIQSPYRFKLAQNYPNPFNPKTEISYEIAKDVIVSIKIYNVLGQLIINLVNNEFKKAGPYKIEFDGTNIASGVYFYTIDAGDFMASKKMVLIK